MKKHNAHMTAFAATSLSAVGAAGLASAPSWSAARRRYVAVESVLRSDRAFAR